MTEASFTTVHWSNNPTPSLLGEMINIVSDKTHRSYANIRKKIYIYTNTFLLMYPRLASYVNNYVAKTSPLFVQLQPAECWDYRHISSCLAGLLVFSISNSSVNIQLLQTLFTSLPLSPSCSLS